MCLIDNEVAMLDVLDTSGQEEYSAMRYQYVRFAEGFVLLYSITSYESFEEILAFQQNILKIKDKEYFPIILVGNHCEREDERQVSKKDGEALARSFGCGFFEASSTERINIEEAFFDLVRDIRRYKSGLYSWPMPSTPPKKSSSAASHVKPSWLERL